MRLRDRCENGSGLLNIYVGEERKGAELEKNLKEQRRKKWKKTKPL